MAGHVGEAAWATVLLAGGAVDALVTGTSSSPGIPLKSMA